MIKKIISFYGKLKNSEFATNVSKLTTGTAVAQLISVGTAPILYRIYDKEDYGTLGLFMAITGIIGVFSTMKYSHAILLEKEDSSAKTIMWLNRLINLTFSIFCLIVVFIFGEMIATSLGNEKISPWLYLLPISIFFSGQGEIFRIWANRKKKYRLLMINSILTAMLVPIVSIGIGLFHNGPLGLFLGLVVSHTIPPLVLLIGLSKKESFGFQFLKFDIIKQLAFKYKKFPIYSVPTDFVNNLSHNLPVLMLSKFYGAEVVALFSLAKRMLGIPTSLIAGSVSEVYRQKITSHYNKQGNIKEFYLKTIRNLLPLSIIMFGVIILLIPYIFPVLFGPKWNEAIQISQIMSVIYFLQFFNSPISYIMYIKEKHHIDLIASIYFVCSTYFTLWLSNYLNFDYISAIWAFVLNFCSIYLVMVFYNHKLSIQLKNEI